MELMSTEKHIKPYIDRHSVWIIVLADKDAVLLSNLWIHKLLWNINEYCFYSINSQKPTVIPTHSQKGCENESTKGQTFTDIMHTYTNTVQHNTISAQASLLANAKTVDENDTQCMLELSITHMLDERPH